MSKNNERWIKIGGKRPFDTRYGVYGRPYFLSANQPEQE
jgi:hypothetical protein